MLKKKLDNNFSVYSWQKKITSKNALSFLQVEQLYTEKLYQLYTRKLYFIEFFQKTLKMNPKNGPI